MSTSDKRISVYFPQGLETKIRSGAAERGLSVATYYQLLAERGFRAESAETTAGDLARIGDALEALAAHQTPTLSAEMTGPVLQVLLRTLAEIYARTHTLAGRGGIEARQLDTLARQKFDSLALALNGEALL